MSDKTLHGVIVETHRRYRDNRAAQAARREFERRNYRVEIQRDATGFRLHAYLPIGGDHEGTTLQTIDTAEGLRRASQNDAPSSGCVFAP